MMCAFYVSFEAFISSFVNPSWCTTQGVSHTAASSMHRFDRAATALATAMDAWESMERLSQAAFEQSVRYRGGAPALA